jgi:hypothetical protein
VGGTDGSMTLSSIGKRRLALVELRVMNEQGVLSEQGLSHLGVLQRDTDKARRADTLLSSYHGSAAHVVVFCD